MTVTSHELQYIFFITFRSLYFRMRNILDQSCRENQNAHFVFSNFFSKTVPFVRKRGKICRAGQVTDDNVIWRMRIACWIPKYTNTHTHSEYVILIVFPLQQRWHERASILRYTYIACL